MDITQGQNGFSTSIVNELTKDLRLQGWRECITSTPPTPTKEQEVTGFFAPIYIYNEDEDNFTQSWEFVKDVTKIENEIESLKGKLSDTDYIIIKTYEARLMGEQDPYTADELSRAVSYRVSIRDEINELEKLLS